MGVGKGWPLESGRYEGGSNPRGWSELHPYNVERVVNCRLDGFALGVGWFGVGGEGIQT